MADLQAFCDPAFDPKKFVNKACADRTGDEPVERFLAELEMKLHLAAEDASLYLQDHSSRAATRIPAAAKELLRIKDNVQGLRSDAAVALKQLEDAEAGAAAAVSTLKDLDRVKQRMEAACTTLREATGLSSLFQRVDDLFAAGDPARVADALAGMRRGLAVVGDSVQEFRGGRERLARLEERFAAMVEGPLATALAQQKGQEVRALGDMLVGIGKGDAVVRLYSSTRVAPLQSLWDSYTPATPFVAWLATFYDQLLAAVRAEGEWLYATLPERFVVLLPALLSGFLSRIDKPYRQRLAGALAGGAGTLSPLERLEQAQAAALDFAQGLQQLFASTPPSSAVPVTAAAQQQQGGSHTPAAPPAVPGVGFSLLPSPALPSPGAGAGHAAPAVDFPPLLALVLAPVEDAVRRYSDMEQQYISAELQHLASKAVQGTGAAALETLPPQLAAAISPAFAALDAALSRCAALTAGTALPALARVLDRTLQQFAAALLSAVQGLRARVVGGGKEGSPPSDNSAESEALLPMLLLADSLSQQLSSLESNLRQAAAEASRVLLQEQQHPSAGTALAAEPCNVATAAALRLQAQQALQQALAGFASAAAAGQGPLLASAAGAVAEVCGGVEGLVFDVLLGRVRAQLQVSTLPEWQAKQSGLPLPSFTPYPLQYITAVGEYLMMLPQLLESSLLGEEESEEAALLVAEWIDKVTLGAATVYLEQLQQVAALSPLGAGQLAADLEYFANVLTTLGVAVPAELAAWQVATSSPPETLPDVAASAGGEGGSLKAKAAVEKVARLRGVALGAVV